MTWKINWKAQLCFGGFVVFMIPAFVLFCKIEGGFFDWHMWVTWIFAYIAAHFYHLYMKLKGE